VRLVRWRSAKSPTRAQRLLPRWDYPASLTVASAPLSGRMVPVVLTPVAHAQAAPHAVELGSQSGSTDTTPVSPTWWVHAVPSKYLSSWRPAGSGAQTPTGAGGGVGGMPAPLGASEKP